MTKQCDELDQTAEEYLAAVKAEARLIDPETAIICCRSRSILDPYGVDPVPDEYDQIGKVRFARRPSSDIWVCFYDLPEDTLKRLGWGDDDVSFW